MSKILRLLIFASYATLKLKLRWKGKFFPIMITIIKWGFHCDIRLPDRSRNAVPPPPPIHSECSFLKAMMKTDGTFSNHHSDCRLMQNPKNLTQQKRKWIPLSYLSIPFLLNGPFFFLGCWSLRYWPTLPQAPLKDSGRYSWGWSIAVKSTCSSCFGFLQLLSSQTTKQNHQVPEALLTSGLFWGKYVGKFGIAFLFPSRCERHHL